MLTIEATSLETTGQLSQVNAVVVHQGVNRFSTRMGHTDQLFVVNFSLRFPMGPCCSSIATGCFNGERCSMNCPPCGDGILNFFDLTPRSTMLRQRSIKARSRLWHNPILGHSLEVITDEPMSESSQRSHVLAILPELDKAVDWLRDLGAVSSSSRIEGYRNDIHRLESLGEGKHAASVINSVQEAFDLILIYRAFHGRNSRGVEERLKLIAKGPRYLVDERPRAASDRARNIEFELLMASRFVLAGFSVNLETETDIVLRFENYVLLAECKRPFGQTGLRRGVKDGCEQLSKRLRTLDLGSNPRGILIVSVSQLVNRDTSILKTNDENSANAALERLLQKFLLGVKSQLRKRLDHRIIGVCAHIEMPCKLNTYPGIVFNYRIAVSPAYDLVGRNKLLGSFDQRLLQELASKLRNSPSTLI